MASNPPTSTLNETSDNRGGSGLLPPWSNATVIAVQPITVTGSRTIRTVPRVAIVWRKTVNSDWLGLMCGTFFGMAEHSRRTR
jgi:hypothetical protein